MSTTVGVGMRGAFEDVGGAKAIGGAKPGSGVRKEVGWARLRECHEQGMSYEVGGSPLPNDGGVPEVGGSPLPNDGGVPAQS